MEPIAASRCPTCALVTVPPEARCPWHPVPMATVELEGVGEVESFTTLHSPPEGFRAPLHIALVRLEGGAGLLCHGASRPVRLGAPVGIEAVDGVYYFSHLGPVDRARMFWRRAGRTGDRWWAVARSLAKTLRKGPPSAAR